MKKRILSTLLAFAMVLTLLPGTAWAATVASGTCGTNLTWILDEDGMLTILGTGSMEDYSYNSMPWYSSRSQIKTVVIGNGITSVGSYAFYDCTNLNSVTIPGSVASIGNYAFYNCLSLTSVTIPKGVTYFSISAENAEIVELDKTTGVSVLGNSLSYDVRLTTNGGNHMFGISGQTESAVNVCYGENDVAEIRADNLKNVTFESLYDGTSYVFSSNDGTATIVETSDNSLSIENRDGRKTYAIFFNPNGGTVDSIYSSTNVMGKLDSLPIPTRTGYTFDGWYTTTNGDEKVSEDRVYSKNTTLYAHWAKDVVQGHTHNWSTTWSSDANGHWHNCISQNCPITTNSQKDGYAPHTSDGGKVTTPATSTTDGTRTYSCMVCGYVIRAENIPATGDSSSSGGSSSGSSGGSSSGNGYSISTPSKVTGGTVRVSPSNAGKGITVTVTVTPDTGYKLDKLTVTDSKGNELKLVDKGDGKFQFVMPASKVNVNAAFVKVEDVPTQPTSRFTDVPSGTYYADAVAWAVEKGITVGTSATTFSPNASCTRAQTVTFLWRAAGSPAPQGSTNPFTDVQPGTYCYDAVLWAVEQGITSGTSATMFSPDAIVTRGQTVTFLYRATGSPETSGSNSFGDVDSNTYYASAVQWAVDKGVTSGTSATTFSPDSNCTRAQIVTFLYRNRAN